MKRKQLGLLRVIDISKKKKKKKRERKEKTKEKRKEKEKTILVVRLWPMKKCAMKVFLIFIDIKICWYLDTCWIDCGYNSYHYCMVIGWLI